MTAYAGACQDLGFLCDRQLRADTPESVAAGLVDHLNHAHGTGSTSPALHALVEHYVTEIPASRQSRPAHAKEHAS